MKKFVKYFLCAAVMGSAMVACQEDPEDTFSSAPTAAVLAENSSILMTKNTMDESVTFAWSAARNFGGTVNYQVYGEYLAAAEPVTGAISGTTTALQIEVSKTELKKACEQFGAPENSKFALRLFVRATDGTSTVDSDPVNVQIYSYGNAISPVVTLTETELVLDMDKSEDNITLCSWTEARLEYAEEPTYKVALKYQENNPTVLAEGLTDMVYTLTVDELNEGAVAAGAPESEAADIQVLVYAVSETYPEGIVSAAQTLKLTTYAATFPEKLYLAGSYQGWKPGEPTCATIPQSTLTKGLFEAFVNLTDPKNEETEFKFCIKNAWGGDFGSDDITVTTGGQNNTTIVKGSTVGGGNIKVPSGIYRVSCDMKHKTLEMEKVVTVGLIGSAVSTGWSEEVKMEYDTVSNSYSVKTTLAAGEYKFRINDDWDFSIGDNGAFSGGFNYAFDKTPGEYKVTLSVGSHPYAVKVVSTSYPESLYYAGDWTGWQANLKELSKIDADKGLYQGFYFIKAVDNQNTWGFKFVEKDGENLKWYGGGNGVIDGDSNCDPGAEGFYKFDVDWANRTYTLTKINTISFIGDVTGDSSWGTDVDMTWNGECWEYTGELKAGNFKFRANHDWNGINWGGDPTNLVIDKSNASLAEAGNYNVKLYCNCPGKAYYTITAAGN